MNNMNKLLIKGLLLAMIVFYGCSPSRKIPQAIMDADKHLENGEYDQALALYDPYISSTTGIRASVYRNAGIAAFELGNMSKAASYLNQLRDSNLMDERVYHALAIANRQINNLSREITALEQFVGHYPGSEHFGSMQLRLFETYVESRNFDAALALWPAIEQEGIKNEIVLSQYLFLVEALEKEKETVKTAQDLLALNAHHKHALFVLAKHFFWKAENLYQKEMEAYQKNRTHSQYARLLRAFEVLNADFRTSLNYFLRLYNLDPQPQYATYIGNIYLRFDDKTRADQYHNRARQ
jgi:hypothetical protein